MIVADANLIVYRFLEGAMTERARRVAERDDDWVVPPLWRHEFANVLRLNVAEAGLVVGEALAIYAEADALLSERERDVDITDALRLAAEHSVSVYDAEYVVLARSLHVPLVTEDQELQRKFPAHAVSMRRFVETAGGTLPETPFSPVVREGRSAYGTRRKR